MSLLVAALVLAQETPSVAEEGRNIVTAMLVVGLIFLGVIALGQLSRHMSHRRKARKAARTRVY
jgi:heme/copper-type cytochrome/quinol oxidase subunit 2